PDPRYHWFAALSRLTAGDHGGVLEACRRVAERTAAKDASPDHVNGAPAPALGVEAEFLAGLAHLELRDDAAAAHAFAVPARTAGSPSAAHALALWGLACFQQNQHEEAVERWQALDAA